MKEKGLINETDAQQISRSLAQGEGILESLLMNSGLTEEQLLRHIAEEFGYPFFENLDKFHPSNKFLAQFWHILHFYHYHKS